MKYKTYTVEDFLADKNFINWVTSPCAESNTYWHGVIQSYPEKREAIEEAVELLKLIHFRGLSITDEERNRILRNTISFKYSERSKYINGSAKKGTSLKFIQIAVIIFIFISIGTFLTFQFSEWNDISSSLSPDDVEMITKQNPAGRKSRFYLPDGSQVALNADSKIVYYSNFKEKREVWLSGEASFEVKENLKNNFFVYTRNLNIIVKGTTFNVSAFENDLKESISLLSGKVNVLCSNEYIDEAHELLSGEKLSINMISNELTVSDLVMDEIVWSSGILVFKNDDFKTFTKKIQRWYGVVVEVSGTPEVEININGKFDNESLINVLESLKFSTGIDYNLIDQKVKIQF